MNNVLNGLNEKGVRKLKDISSLITGATVMPSFSEKLEAKDIIEDKLTGEGTVTLKYVNDVLISLEYAQRKRHIFTKNFLIDDIKKGSSIQFPYYH